MIWAYIVTGILLGIIAVLSVLQSENSISVGSSQTKWIGSSLIFLLTIILWPLLLLIVIIALVTNLFVQSVGNTLTANELDKYIDELCTDAPISGDVDVTPVDNKKMTIYVDNQEDKVIDTPNLLDNFKE